MNARLNAYKIAPDLMKAVAALDAQVLAAGLEPALMELVKIRASQINGCAYCLHLHTKDARANGEAEARIYLLNAWRESSLYSARERAALLWTETLTLIAEGQAPDVAYNTARFVLGEADMVKLTLLIGMINIWNRIAIGFRSQHPVHTPLEAA